MRTGNRTKMSISGSAYTSADIAYTYDDAYQLTGEVRTGGNAYAQYFWYDGNGNRTKSSLDATNTTYLYNAADQLTSEATAQTTMTYLYDASGSLTKSDDGTNVQSYAYNYENRLTSYAKPGGSSATYAYDSDFRRVAKTVDATTTKFFYDRDDAIADYAADGTLQATYITPSLDRNLSVTRSGSTYYYMADGLGSIRNLLDSSEAAQNVYDYCAFGKALGSWTENVTNRFTYTAREWDGESGQYYYRARYYAGDGRFTARDPLTETDQVTYETLTRSLDLNPYSVVNNNPPNSVDPLGLSTIWIGFGWDLSATMNGTLGFIGAQQSALKDTLDKCSKLPNCCAPKVDVKRLVDGNRKDKKLPPGKVYNLDDGPTHLQAETNIGNINVGGPVAAHVLITTLPIKLTYGPSVVDAAGVRVTNDGILLTTAAQPTTLAHELGHIAGYVGDERGVHSSDEKNIMHKASGTEPDCQWCTKVTQLAR